MAGNSSFSSWLGSNTSNFLGLATGIITQVMNQKNQDRQNVFNAIEAAKNRNFQAQQFQLARDYQTEFYETYQSPSAMVRQYNDAGLNPALMAGGYNPPSAVSTSSPSGSAASAASPNYQSMDSMINAIASLAQLKANIENTKADTNLKNAQAGQSISQVEVNKQSINESKARISKLISETRNEDEKRGLIVAQKLLTNIESQLKTSQTEQISYQILREKWEKEFKDTYGAYPAENAYQAIQRVFDIFMNTSGLKDLPLFGKIFK